jgi:hypothetical protein
VLLFLREAIKQAKSHRPLGLFLPIDSIAGSPSSHQRFSQKVIIFFSLSVAAAAGADALIARLAVVSIGQPSVFFSLSLQQAKLLWKVSLSIPWVGSSAEELKRKHKKAPGAVLSLSRSALFLSIVAADDFETRAGTVRRVWWSPPCHVTTLCASLYSLIRS